MTTIALLTDFGTRDPYVAAMKGVLASHGTPSIVDLTHEIALFDVWEAAFFLRDVIAYWPRETIFVCVVDPGVGSERRIIAVESEGQIFLAPDNGLLHFVEGDAREVTNESLFLPRGSTTFHGRDRFAPIAAALANGLSLDDLGARITDRVLLDYAPGAIIRIAARYAALQAAVAARTSGSTPYVFDRNGGTIAVIRANDAVATNADFASLIDRQAGDLTIGAKLLQLGINDTIETTLDPFVQKAALKALGDFRGSLVAIDPRTNEILAIASSRGKGPLANLALEHQYEPGSVVKVLTSLNAENGAVDVASLFPYTCKGYLDIDGRHFGDWLPAGHGTLNSIDDALAVSCNVFFADVGLRLGVDRLKPFMTAAGFDGQADLGVFQVPLGKTIGQSFNRFETAFLAIGLEHESMNALHVAMIASMMANRGELTTLKLLVQRRSILGDVASTGPKQTKSRLASPGAAEKVVHAMEAVATEAKGTGHRAPVSGITLAMKTGTAGERKSGLEALILAFAPVESPRIAFGVIAEDAGPAEFAGAKIAHDFLEAMSPRLK